MQWLTFGCHQFGARTAARVQLQTEVQRLEQLQEEDHQSRIVVLMERAKSEWELDTSVSKKIISIFKRSLIDCGMLLQLLDVIRHQKITKAFRFNMVTFGDMLLDVTN